jgi:hypothetical protein
MSKGLLFMAKIKKFEEINAWQKARELTNKIYQITEKGKFINDFTLKNQIRKASMSIMFNISEGFARKLIKNSDNSLVMLMAQPPKYNPDYILH